MRLLLSALSCGLLAASCARGPEASASAAAAPAAAHGNKVAEVAGEPVTLAQVDEKAAGRLARVRDDEYEARRTALEEIIAERLLEKAARERHLTREALLKAEVQDKVSAPTEPELRAIFESNRSRLPPGTTFAAVREQIVASLRGRALAEREASFYEELRGKAAVTVTLEQPRATVAVPADAPTYGPADAPVTIVEFLDYQCPFCHRVQPLIDELMARYPGKLRFVSRDFLLDKPRSLATARAARCASEQGKFWDYHRNLLTQPGDFGDGDLRARATRLGLDGGRFDTCVATGRYDAQIRASSEQGHDLGVSGTPAFFINGRRVSGVRPIEQYAEIIDAELKRS
jgi:protein-disulfide isomerase